MIKTYTGDLMMTVDELEKENNRVLYAYGDNYLGFNLKHFVTLANKHHTLLWCRMLEVDREIIVHQKISRLQSLLEELTQ